MEPSNVATTSSTSSSFLCCDSNFDQQHHHQQHHHHQQFDHQHFEPQKFDRQHFEPQKFDRHQQQQFDPHQFDESVGGSMSMENDDNDDFNDNNDDEDEDSASSSNFCCAAEPRGRCYTWPVPQQQLPSQQSQQQQQQILQQQMPSCSSRLPSLASLSPTTSCGGAGQHGHGHSSSLSQATFAPFGPGNNLLFLCPSAELPEHEEEEEEQQFQQLQQLQQQQGQQPQLEEGLGLALAPVKPPKPKRVRRKTADGTGMTTAGGTGKKPNPWGEESYSDLIARALGQAMDGRLKLNEVYQWFSDNIPYFAAQKDAHGWKNSIRHNLSLHSRFMRIQNEGAGKSSWWVINPDAKPGRNPRRRANTMENASRTAMDKKRRGARKRVEQQLVQQHKAGPSSMATSMADLFPGEAQDQAGDMAVAGVSTDSGGGPGNFETFRPRAQSTLSVTGPSRISPKLEPAFEDIDFPPWMDQQSSGQPQTVNPQVNELLDRTDQMRLESVVRGQQQQQNGIKMVDSGQQQLVGGPLLLPKTEMMESMKQETTPTTIQPPPSYQELSAIRRPSQMQQGSPVMLQQLGGGGGGGPQQQMISPLKMSASLMSGLPGQPPAPPIFTSMAQPMFVPSPGTFPWNPAVSNGVSVSQMLLQQQFGGIGIDANGGIIMGQGGGQQLLNNIGGQGQQQPQQLPMDLENVNAMSVDQSLLGSLDLDAMLRNELAQGGRFDLP